MTANELADYITENSYIGTVTMEDVATMLRQQQAEIEELETGLKNVWKVVEGKQTEIEALKDEVAKWKMSYENNIRFEDGYGHN